MSRRTFFRPLADRSSSFLVASLVASGALVACSSSSSSSSTSVTLAIAPSDAKILTCESLSFKETGGAGGGTWAATPGDVDATGLYTAPLTAADTVDGSVTYTERTASASATIHVATAFVGPVSILPTNASANAAGENSPFEHTFSGSGSSIYAAVMADPVGDAVVDADIYASSDNGATFTLASSYHTGNLECVTVAADAGDPQVVYMVYYAGHGDSTSNTGGTIRLAVSEDGAKTFPKEYIVADSDNSIVDFICPDVASPSADHVIVAGITVNDTSEWVGTFVSGNRGADIGPIGTPTVAGAANTDPSSIYSASDTNSGSAVANCAYNADGNNYGPRVFGNGNGTACITFTGDFGSCGPANGIFAQCSSDNGATWTAKTTIAAPTPMAKELFTGAVSPSGNVALTWVDTVGSEDEVFVVISKDGGKTFGTPVQYPTASRKALQGGYTGNPTLAWESDDILWLSQTIDGADQAFILVDKTCDFGASWSGAINAGSYDGTGLILTSSGMNVTGYERGGTYDVVVASLAATGS